MFVYIHFIIDYHVVTIHCSSGGHQYTAPRVAINTLLLGVAINTLLLGWHQYTAPRAINTLLLGWPSIHCSSGGHQYTAPRVAINTLLLGWPSIHCSSVAINTLLLGGHQYLLPGGHQYTAPRVAIYTAPRVPSITLLLGGHQYTAPRWPSIHCSSVAINTLLLGGHQYTAPPVAINTLLLGGHQYTAPRWPSIPLLLGWPSIHPAPRAINTLLLLGWPSIHCLSSVAISPIHCSSVAINTLLLGGHQYTAPRVAINTLPLGGHQYTAPRVAINTLLLGWPSIPAPRVAINTLLLGWPSIHCSSGHFLYLGLRKSSTNTNNTRQIKSPWLEESSDTCKLEADYNVWKKHDVTNVIKVLIENGNFTSITTIVDTVKLNKTSPEWACGHHNPGPLEVCQGIRCGTGECVRRNNICDITKNCPGGEDESTCALEPEGSRCDFESDWCGWKNAGDDHMDFHRHHGNTQKERTGPSNDHTYKNDSGYYLLSELPQTGKMGDLGVLESPYFDPPPCYHGNKDSPFFESCKIRLYYHKLGRNQGSMIIKAREENPKVNGGRVYQIDQITGDQGDKWQRLDHVLPHEIRYRYQIIVANVRGSRFRGDLGFDDFTLSPECFGRGVPPDEVKKCPPASFPTTPGPIGSSHPPTPDEPPEGVVMVTTCGATGHEGPTAEECREEYRNRPPPVPDILSSTSLPGTQTWRVPHNGLYTILAKGASGGGGVQTQDMTTHGAISRGTFYLTANTELYILVGQEGMSACKNAPTQVSSRVCVA
ncbi:ALK tyrosine kinase receptor-like [Homarus americanus]|uniref:ALK tyrosine kinase receptor-like n=1 Tax=Homarus americanus TaxID=6706 RepID=UPI001C48D760|nr:ALK tyrosine kinase receptor-like [Homarus americanus]